MQEANKILDGLKISLEGMAELRNQFMKQLTPEQRVRLSKFEVDYALLMKNGDLIGAKNLQEKFNQEMK
jgi:hypothetical protein